MRAGLAWRWHSPSTNRLPIRASSSCSPMTRCVVAAASCTAGQAADAAARCRCAVQAGVDGRDPGGGRAVEAADRRADDRRAAPASSSRRARSGRWAPWTAATPAIGVGGNVPVLVDATADLAKVVVADRCSNSFYNFYLVDDQLVLIVTEQAVCAAAGRSRPGATCSSRPAGPQAVRPRCRFDIRFVGQDASLDRGQAGLRVPKKTRVLLALFDLVALEERAARSSALVLGLVRRPPGADRRRRGWCCGSRLDAALGSPSTAWTRRRPREYGPRSTRRRPSTLAPAAARAWRLTWPRR